MNPKMNSEKEIILMQNDKIIILTGHKNSGKTGFANRAADILKEKGFRVGGILSMSITEDGGKTGYNLFDLRNGEFTLLCSMYNFSSDIRTGRFGFYDEGLLAGNFSLRDYDYDIIFIDEAGRLELDGGGWSESIEKALKNYNGIMVLVIRQSLKDLFIEKYRLDSCRIFDVKKDEIQQAVAYITGLMK